jgi:hypothetical protein
MDSRRRKVELLHLNVQVRVLLLLVFQGKVDLKEGRPSFQYRRGANVI